MGGGVELILDVWGGSLTSSPLSSDLERAVFDVDFAKRFFGLMEPLSELCCMLTMSKYFVGVFEGLILMRVKTVASATEQNILFFLPMKSATASPI